MTKIPARFHVFTRAIERKDRASLTPVMMMIAAPTIGAAAAAIGMEKWRFNQSFGRVLGCKDPLLLLAKANFGAPMFCAEGADPTLPESYTAEPGYLDAEDVFTPFLEAHEAERLRLWNEANQRKWAAEAAAKAAQDE